MIISSSFLRCLDDKQQRESKFSLSPPLAQKGFFDIQSFSNRFNKFSVSTIPDVEKVLLEMRNKISKHLEGSATTSSSLLSYTSNQNLESGEKQSTSVIPVDTRELANIDCQKEPSFQQYLERVGKYFSSLKDI